jgi:hypothetical protein
VDELRGGVAERLSALPSSSFIEPAAIFTATRALLASAARKVTDPETLSKTPVCSTALCMRNVGPQMMQRC